MSHAKTAPTNRIAHALDAPDPERVRAALRAWWRRVQDELFWVQSELERNPAFVRGVQRNADIIAVHGDRMWGFEVKGEGRFTGNLFLETWSNFAPGSWARPGWVVTSECDWLFYYFADEERLFIIEFKPLQEWFFGVVHDNGYREVSQGKYTQRNKTCGRLVPIKDISENVGLHELVYRDGRWVSA